MNAPAPGIAKMMRYTAWANARLFDALAALPAGVAEEPRPGLGSMLRTLNHGKVVRFTFVGGGAGAMTRGEILLHVANHKTHHRGNVGA